MQDPRSISAFAHGLFTQHTDPIGRAAQALNNPALIKYMDRMRPEHYVPANLAAKQRKGVHLQVFDVLDRIAEDFQLQGKGHDVIKSVCTRRFLDITGLQEVHNALEDLTHYSRVQQQRLLDSEKKCAQLHAELEQAREEITTLQGRLDLAATHRSSQNDSHSVPQHSATIMANINSSAGSAVSENEPANVSRHAPRQRTHLIKNLVQQVQLITAGAEEELKDTLRPTHCSETNEETVNSYSTPVLDATEMRRQYGREADSIVESCCVILGFMFQKQIDSPEAAAAVSHMI